MVTFSVNIFNLLESIVSLAISNNDQRLVTGSLDRSIKILYAETLEELYHFKDAHNGIILKKNCSIWKDCVTSVAISHDDKFIASASSDKSIKLFDFTTKQEIHKFSHAHERKKINKTWKFIISFRGTNMCYLIKWRPISLLRLYRSNYQNLWPSNKARNTPLYRLS